MGSLKNSFLTHFTTDFITKVTIAILTIFTIMFRENFPIPSRQQGLSETLSQSPYLSAPQSPPTSPQPWLTTDHYIPITVMFRENFPTPRVPRRTSVEEGEQGLSESQSECSLPLDSRPSTLKSLVSGKVWYIHLLSPLLSCTATAEVLR